MWLMFSFHVLAGLLAASNVRYEASSGSAMYWTIGGLNADPHARGHLCCQIFTIVEGILSGAEGHEEGHCPSVWVGKNL
jgi:hypothetical protein